MLWKLKNIIVTFSKCHCVVFVAEKNIYIKYVENIRASIIFTDFYNFVSNKVKFKSQSDEVGLAELVSVLNFVEWSRIMCEPKNMFTLFLFFTV